MSLTETRGQHTATKWSTPALEIIEQMNTGRPASKGAVAAIDKFCQWVLVGATCARIGHVSSAHAARRQATEDAFEIVRKIYRTECPRQIELLIEAHRRTLTGIRFTRKTPIRSEDRKKFCEFLSAIISQAKKEKGEESAG